MVVIDWWSTNHGSIEKQLLSLTLSEVCNSMMSPISNLCIAYDTYHMSVYHGTLIWPEINPKRISCFLLQTLSTVSDICDQTNMSTSPSSQGLHHQIDVKAKE